LLKQFNLYLIFLFNILGLPFSDFSHILYPDGLFGSKENSGLMFMRSTSQCLKKITLPSPPYLLGILLHKCEIPWAKIFPLRLITKLGADFKSKFYAHTLLNC
jgi:zinc finger FYVE domain-containing protein 9